MTTPDQPIIRPRRPRLEIRVNPSRTRPIQPEPDALDREIDDALATGRQINLATVYPEPPPIAPGENLWAHHPVPGVDTADEDRSPVPTGGTENMTPAQRLRHVAVMAPTYVDEYRSRLVHRLLLRRLPLDVIAQQLGCTVRAVNLMKNKLNKRAARQAKTMSVYDVAAESIRFYHEVRGLAMRQVDDRTIDLKSRQVAMRIALDAENDKVRFLSASGYFENQPYVTDKSTTSDPEQEKVDKTLSMLSAVLSADTTSEDIARFFESDELGEGEGSEDWDGLDPSADLL